MRSQLGAIGRIAHISLRVAVAVALTAASAVVLAPSAGAYIIDACRWRSVAGSPPTQITYTNVDLKTGINAQYRGIEEDAVSNWNDLVGGNVAFASVPANADATIDSVYLGADAPDGVTTTICDGSYYYMPGARVRLNQSTLNPEIEANRPQHVLAIAHHELGHAIGLHHEDRLGCTPIMRTTVCWDQTVAPSLDDVNGAKARYPVSAGGVCVGCPVHLPRMAGKEAS